MVLGILGAGKLHFPDQPKQLIRRHFSAHVGAIEEAVSQCPFCLVQGHYFFFNSVPGDQAVNGNRPFLPDPVGAEKEMAWGEISDANVRAWTSRKCRSLRASS